MIKTANLFSSLVLLLAASQVSALPIQLNEADFNAQTSGMTKVIEDFEGYPVSGRPNPFVFANGTYTSTAPSLIPVIVNNPVYCVGGDKCLINQDITSQRIFNNFLTGTTFWGAYLDFVQVSNLFSVTVTGGSGVLSFDFTPNQQSYFLGFNDASDIFSISIKNFGNGRGFGTYSFDNITTASGATSVPEPAMLILFALGLSVLGFIRFKNA